MKRFSLYTLPAILIVGTLCAHAQNPQAAQQLHADFLQAIDNTSMDEQQKTDLRGTVNQDFETLKTAKQERDRKMARGVFQDLKKIASQSGFSEQDRQKIAEDMQQFPAAR
jgi:hypothetical protein